MMNPINQSISMHIRKYHHQQINSQILIIMVKWFQWIIFYENVVVVVNINHQYDYHDFEILPYSFKNHIDNKKQNLINFLSLLCFFLLLNFLFQIQFSIFTLMSIEIFSLLFNRHINLIESNTKLTYLLRKLCFFNSLSFLFSWKNFWIIKLF